MKSVRVRFAPSPTGPLHIGGVRTALYNYLFAKKHRGTFILRIEDTDQSRLVPGAEAYIQEALAWCGIHPDEGGKAGGQYAPYRQSERQASYQQYAQQLVDSGNAYYAFDTAEELDAMRQRLKEARVAQPQYNAISRMSMKNGLTLGAEEVRKRLESGEPYVIRLKTPRKEEVRLQDLIRGWVVVQSSALNDKVLMKSDGMPTYHLANVVNDHLMQITHVIRGEEWLPSAPLHVLLYRYLGWEDEMPQFAHLPLILNPDGNGKLSKRSGDRFGFPVYPIDWTDPATHEVTTGFRETGYLPEAVVNFLALLGWNPGDEQEMFSLQEMIDRFSLERINKAGAQFDIEKARWFNQQYLKNKPDQELAVCLQEELEQVGIDSSDQKAAAVSALMKERVTFPTELWTSAQYFYRAPEQYDEKTASKKWTQEAATAISAYADALASTDNDLSADAAKEVLVKVLEQQGMKIGKIMPALRLALTGEGGGPDLMQIIEVLGRDEVVARIRQAQQKLSKYVQ